MSGLLTATLGPTIGSTLRGIADKGAGGNSPLPIPNGFGWTPPVSVYRSADGVYSTDFNADEWKVAATASLYVATTGSDTTGTGAIGSPYASIKKALTSAAVLSDTSINIFVATGEYAFNTHFSGQACAKDLNIIATGGRVLATNKINLTSWTLDGTGTYKATRSSIQDVRDARYPTTQPDGFSLPQLLLNVASVAACQAAAGSWYSDGTTLWIHLSDGRIPDAGATGDVGCIIGSVSGLMSSDNRWFVQGFDFEGGSASCMQVTAGIGVTVTQFVMDDCTFRFQRSALSRSLVINGVANCIINNCRSYTSEGDGLGYSRRDSSSPSSNVVEINCRSFSAGYASTQTEIQNGSTSHANCHIVRVNGWYSGTYGPVVAEVNAAMTWNLGCSAMNCLLGTADSQDACFQAGNPSGDTVKIWLDGCNTGGAHFDTYAGAGCQILYRNMGAPASMGGAGTVGVY